MTITKGLKAIGAAVLFVAFVWGALATPGFLSDQDSTVPVVQVQAREAFR